jgi:hypothetical protein
MGKEVGKDVMVLDSGASARGIEDVGEVEV